MGGGGGSAINTMVENRISGVEFILADTAQQSLEEYRADISIPLDLNLTKGMGVIADQQVNKNESFDLLVHALQGLDMAFVVATLGGNTGTLATPAIAKLCNKESGALTIAVVTTPFDFDCKRKNSHVEVALEKLKEYSDTIITVPCDRLFSLMQEKSYNFPPAV